MQQIQHSGSIDYELKIYIKINKLSKNISFGMNIDSNKVEWHKYRTYKKEGIMKKLLKKFENIYAAVAFAEAGEVDTARDIMREEDRARKRERITPRPRPQLRAPGIKR